MTTTKKKKSAREKRVLVASIICAGLIVAGSTFAWFTSQDEVTNRLSASADYNVTIAEDFTPPENWVPGQTIDKNVGVVNTGNTDAFVRMWLEGEMRMIAQSTSSTTAASMAATTPEAVTDQQLLDANLTYKVGDVYLKELSTDKIQNPDTQNAASPTAYSEVMSVQAGGELAYVAPGSSYKFTPNQSMNITNNKGAVQKIDKTIEYTVTVTASPAADAADIVVDNTAKTITLSSLAAFRTIDSNTFTPISDGLYIFRRNVDMVNGSPTGGTNNSEKDDYEFSGYYYKTVGSGDTATKHYFALEYDNTDSQRSDYVLPDSVVNVTLGADNNYTVANNGINMFTATQETIENSELTWTLLKGITKDGVTYTTADSGVTWKKGATALTATEVTAAGLNINDAVDMFQVKRTTGGGDGVLVNIALSNLGTDAEQWTAISATDKTTTFYYNNDVEEGATTSQLVDSLTMDSTVTQNDFIAFDFDLNVLMDSVQVTVDNDGNESYTSVAPWSVVTGATYIDATGAAGTVTNGEIETIAWTATQN